MAAIVRDARWGRGEGGGGRRAGEAAANQGWCQWCAGRGSGSPKSARSCPVHAPAQRIGVREGWVCGASCLHIFMACASIMMGGGGWGEGGWGGLHAGAARRPKVSNHSSTTMSVQTRTLHTLTVERGSPSQATF